MAITANLIAPINPASVQGGFDIPLGPYTDAASATYKVGAALIASGGDLVEGSTFTSTGHTLVGFAMQAGSNLSGTHIANSSGNAGVLTPLLVAPAYEGVVFEGTFANNNADVAINATDLWTAYGLTKDATSGFWYVDKNRTTTNAAVLIIGIKNIQDITLGTTKGARVFFTVLRDATAYGQS